MFLILVLGLARCILCQDLTISMPGVVTPGPEMYMCTSIKVPKETHIIGFETLATSESNVHHMLLFGCSSPGSSSDPVWLCGHDKRGVGNFSHAPVCGGGQSAGMAGRVLYGCSRNADPVKLPEGVGLTVGVDGIDYLVLQVHYAVARPEADFTGVRMTTTPQAPEKHAGIFLLASGESIPPMATSHLNMNCKMKEDVTFYPFAYITHAHNLSPVISGYRVRGDEWTQIGKMDPHKPQMFYSVDTPGMEIKKGDVVAARCTMVSDRKDVTMIGSTNEDEMCAFAIMYWTSTYLLHNSECWFEQIVGMYYPKDASTFDGKEYPETK